MPSLAIVQDALPFRGGAESTLEAILERAPDASLYTAVYCKPNFPDSPLAERTIRTSFIDRLPGARANHYRYAPLFPLAMESFDLRDNDAILSCSYGFAHGVLADPEQLHLCYMYTPLRYAWLRPPPHAALRGPRAWIAAPLLHYLRLWDVAAAARVDRFFAVSQCVAARIRCVYRRRAEVIHPPVDVDAFHCDAHRDDHYVAISRLVPHKRVDVLVDAFSRSGAPLYVVGDGPEHRRLAARATANVKLLGWQPRQRIVELLRGARAFVHAGEEDFGIAPLEAQAAGCPVIAYARGGVTETVIDGRTGLFFAAPTAASLLAALQRFEQGAVSAAPEEMRANAERFSKPRFQRQLAAAMDRSWETFRRRHGGAARAPL